MKQIFLILCLLPFLLVPAAAQQSKSVFIPGDAYTAYNIPAGGSALQLNINRANNNLVIDDSEILLQDASDAVQWYRSSAGPALHVYQIGTVLSSREYVHVFGHYHYTNGSGGGTPPTFNAKVAAPDVDMTSVAEEDEESVGIWLGKNGARKPVTIQAVQCKGPGNEQVLAWSSGKLSLWSAASGGSMLPGNSKSLSASQAYTYYAQGDVASGSVRDSEINVSYTGSGSAAYDKIKVTVVSASFTSFEIIPVNTTQEVSVTVAPNPPGTNITLQLSCLAGSGSAVFIPGDTTLSNITQSTIVKIKGVTASSVASNMILKAMMGNDVLASNVFTVLSVDLTAHRPYTEGPDYGNQFDDHEVPDDQEESPGAGIRVNGDTEAAANENDLIEVELEVEPFPIPSGLTYVLKRTSSSIKVWDSKDMTGACLLDAAEAEITISSSPMSVWVENPSGGSADLELVARSGTTDVCSDKIHFYPFTSIVIALGGEGQDPTDPANANHGIFQLAIDLYEQGYDVHMYNEDGVDTDGDGPVYNEVVNAIQNRNVTQVAIYGYSHGGGSTHDLAERLDDNSGTIGTFSVPFTAYIDAVAQPLAAQENRRPPGSAYHVNYYQVGVGNPLDPWFDYGLDGGPIDNPPGADHEVNVDAAGQTHTHQTIDDDANVLNGVETRLTPRVAK